QGPPLVEAVGDHAAPDAEQQQGQELQRQHEAEREPGAALAGEVEDEPALGGGLHPRAAERNQLGEEEQAVVADAEGVERALSCQANARHWPSPSSSFSSRVAARASTARSSASRVRIRSER